MSEEQGRAKYVCPYDGVSFTSFQDLKDHVVTQHADLEAPKPEGLLNLIINGRKHVLTVEPNWTLNYLIHDKLGLHSVKMFCDRGACGSCTVIINGRPILSCMILAIECDGAVIETAEGIHAAGHPLIESYVKHHAMQCGYCTPGFVTTAKALLDRNPDPTVEEIVDAISGNLCRCGTYPQHPKAISEAAAKQQRR